MSWTTSSAVTSGEFGIWIRSASGNWYNETIVPSTAPYSTTVNLNVPAGSGYVAAVWYRPAPYLAWTAGGDSPGTFSVSGGLGLTVTAPTGTGSYLAGDPLTVSWTTSSAVTSGEFGIWIRSASGNWYNETIVPSTAPYSTTVNLNVPAGSGYVAAVWYRPAPYLAWITGGDSPGTFSVSGGLGLTVTAPTGTGSYARRGPADRELDDELRGHERRVRDLDQECQRQLVQRDHRAQHRPLLDHRQPQRAGRQRLRSRRLVPSGTVPGLDHRR